MKAKWNAHNGIEWYVVRRFTISSLTEKQFSSYWKPNREYITVYFLFGFQKSTKQRIRNITLYLALCWLGWGGRIWTLEITESESAALPLGDTPILYLLDSAFILYHHVGRKSRGLKIFLSFNNYESANLSDFAYISRKIPCTMCRGSVRYDSWGRVTSPRTDFWIASASMEVIPVPGR